MPPTPEQKAVISAAKRYPKRELMAEGYGRAAAGREVAIKRRARSYACAAFGARLAGAEVSAPHGGSWRGRRPPTASA